MRDEHLQAEAGRIYARHKHLGEGPAADPMVRKLLEALKAISEGANPGEAEQRVREAA